MILFLFISITNDNFFQKSNLNLLNDSLFIPLNSLKYILFKIVFCHNLENKLT